MNGRVMRGSVNLCFTKTEPLNLTQSGILIILICENFLVVN